MTSVPIGVPELLHPSRSCLLVWDLQKGLAGRATWPAESLETVRALIDAAHGAGVPVMWSRHVAPPLAWASPAQLRTLMRRQGVASVDQLVPAFQRGSEDVAFLPGFDPGDDALIEKSTPSLFVGTNAEALLRARGVGTLVLTGVSTEAGIEFTARHAAALGIIPVVVEDAVGSFSAAGHERGMASIRANFDVVSASDVLDAWRTRS